MCVVGTRPEAIKLAPVILALRACPWCELEVVVTAQHRQMLDQALALFGITAERDLNLMLPDQSLAEVTARALVALDTALSEVEPEIVLAQGDTTTVLATAMACFYRRTRFCHVEAGLRTYNLDQPFPEEFNRVVAGRVAALHCAPTEGARQNLLREGIEPGRIAVTGNTVIDALHWMAARQPALPLDLAPDRRLVLVTVHRRENFGQPLRDICRALAQLVALNPDLEILLPLHPNPNVHTVVRQKLGTQAQVRLVAPLDYRAFIAAMQRCHFVLTDSGGVQEEAPALAKPVLVLRQTTERPEAIDAGVARLVGTDSASIVAEAQRLLHDPAHYRQMASGGSPYGDGRAALRIVELVRQL